MFRFGKGVLSAARAAAKKFASSPSRPPPAPPAAPLPSAPAPIVVPPTLYPPSPTSAPAPVSTSTVANTSAASPSTTPVPIYYNQVAPLQQKHVKQAQSVPISKKVQQARIFVQPFQPAATRTAQFYYVPTFFGTLAPPSKLWIGTSNRV